MVLQYLELTDSFTLAVSGFSATINMKFKLTRSVPLQMQMTQPSKSASVFPTASNDDKIFGSWKKKKKKKRAKVSLTEVW